MRSICHSSRLFVAALALGFSLVAPSSLRADDWPQWRGPQRDGVWRETGILQSLPSTGLNFRWRVRIGHGYSGPSVSGGRVFVTDYQPAVTAERILCFEEATGKPLWSHSYPCDYENMEYGNGPRASPTIHDGKVYTLGTKGHLVCLNAETGASVWSRDLVKEYEAVGPRYGISTAPLIEGDLVIISAGCKPDGTFMAFDRNTGAERWKALGERPAYSAPIALTSGGARQIIAWTGDAVTGLEAATGKSLWQIPYKATFDPAQATASPVLQGDMLLCLAAWFRGSLMLKLGADKPAASILWKTRQQPATMISTPFFLSDRHFCGIDGGGALFCADSATGDEVWSTRDMPGGKFGTVHLTPNGDRVFLFDQQGHLILAKFTDKKYEEFGRCLLVEPTAGYRPAGPLTWAHPAYANRHVFARNDRELVCASLAADQTFPAAEPRPARQLPEFTERNSAQALAFTPDGKNLVVGTWGGAAKLIEVADGKELATPAKLRNWVCSVAVSRDGKLLATVGGNEFFAAGNNYQQSAEVKLSDLATKTEIAPLAGHTNKVFAAAFLPDGKTLATGSADRTIRLWDVEAKKERAVLAGHTDAVSSLAVSADGSLLASGSWDKTIKLWDLATLKEVATLAGHEEEVLTVALSPDGKTLASGSADWTVRLWDLPARKQRALLNTHRGAVYAAAFSSDGRTLATGSGDETARLWDPVTAAERTTLRGHQSGIIALTFAPGDQTLVTAGAYDPVRLWSLAVEK